MATDSGEQDASRDALLENYRSILAELSLLTTVSVLLFGFLLTTSRSAPTSAEEWVFAVTMVLVASSTMFFVLPVAYHYLEYPYEDFEKFVSRTHRWIRAGLPLLGFGLYLSLCLAIWSLFGAAALAIAAIPFLVTAVAFVLRKDA